MIVKVMTCRAINRSGFFEAQRSWSQLAGVDGFLAQFGGWDATRTDHALLVGLWRDLASYDAFMREVHDRIHDGSGQARTYADLATVLAEPIDPIADPEIAGEAGHIRMADCRVRSDWLPDFLNVQRSIRTPDLLNAGVIAVWPLRDRNSANHVLVISLWPSTEAHDRYQFGSFTQLPQGTQPDEEVQVLQGWSFALEAAWTVLNPANR